jgi:hypothetical protein
MGRGRLALLALGLVLVAAGVFFAIGPPRFTLINTGLRLEYSWARAVSAFVAALGACLGVVAARPTWARIASAVVGLLLVLWGADLLVYRLEADGQSLSVRSFGRRIAIPWRDVQHVQAGPRLVVVTGGSDQQIQVTTDGFTSDQRATIERTIARRVQEGQQHR